MRSREKCTTATAHRCLVWIVGAILHATLVSAAEEPQPVVQPVEMKNTAATTHPKETPLRDTEWWTQRLASRLSADEASRDFWPRRLSMLFEGIELERDQLAGIDALFIQVQDDRERAKRLVVQRDAALAAGELTHVDVLEAEIDEVRITIRPTRHMERLATVLRAEQQSIYHMNRARVAEKSQRSEERRKPWWSGMTGP